jgi:hypothetical protein
MASVVACAFLTLFAVSPNANPPGISVGKMVFHFNVIAKPGGWDNTLQQACNGSRIFFAEGDGVNGTLGTIVWNLIPTTPPGGFEITDCNATDDGIGVVSANENVNFAFFIRLQGPKTSALSLVCTVIVQSGTDNLCLLDSQVIFKSKGGNFTKIGFNIADGVFENVLWSFSGDWKIFDVRLYTLQ